MANLVETHLTEKQDRSHSQQDAQTVKAIKLKSNNHLKQGKKNDAYCRKGQQNTQRDAKNRQENQECFKTQQSFPAQNRGRRLRSWGEYTVLYVWRMFSEPHDCSVSIGQQCFFNKAPRIN